MYYDKASNIPVDTGLTGITGSASYTPQSSSAYFFLRVHLTCEDIPDHPKTSYKIFPSDASVTVTLPVMNGRTTVDITQTNQNVLFAQAIRVKNAVVRIAGDLDLDLSYMTELYVAPGVQIIGDRTVNPRGPRLFTTSYNNHETTHLLDIGDDGDNGPSDHVRITGIRLDGGESSDPCDSAGNGVPDFDAIDVYSSQYVEIDHNEFYKWRGATVNVHDPGGRIVNGSFSMPWVHDNYIHDNQHPTHCSVIPGIGGHGAGYGVEVSQGGYAFIEKNVFNANRHAIAGGGATDVPDDSTADTLHVSRHQGDGYVLADNLFFDPGIDSENLGFTNYNHQIDMHGQKTCGHGESYNCGPAGEYMYVAFNTIVGLRGSLGLLPLADKSAAIQLRGVPSDPRAGWWCTRTCSRSTKSAR